MGKKNNLDELNIADLTESQINVLKSAEEQINNQGDDVFLIALKKPE